MKHKLITKERMLNMKPDEFRSMTRKGEWTDVTREVCRGYAVANLAIVPKDYAFEFLLFCNRNPRSCPVLDVTEPGDPRPKLVASKADLRTDLPKYRVFKDGEIIDEPTDVIKYWRDDLVSFLLGCSRTFAWALRTANISWRSYGTYRSIIPCTPAGRFHGPVVVGARGFYNSHDATRALQISSRYLLFHGPPIHIGDPAAIGIKDLDRPDPLIPMITTGDQFIPGPPKPGEVILWWGCGITPQAVALESKIPFMITHCPAYMFVTDWFVEEMASM